MDTPEELQKARQKLDKLNGSIQKLLLERLHTIDHIKALKTQYQLPLKDTQREQQILDHLLKDLTDPSEKEHIQNIFQQIFKDSLKKMST